MGPATYQRFQDIRRRHKLLGFLRLIRPQNLLMIALGQFLVSICLLENNLTLSPHSWKQLLILMISTTASAAGGYIINDYYDVKIDVLNKPRQVVVGRLISRRMSLIWHGLLSTIAVLLAFSLGNRLGTMVVFCCFWLWLYSNQLKRLPLIGNASIAMLTSVSVFLPSFLFPPPTIELRIYCLFAFWISLIREIIKDMEDIRGDERHGCKTLPILLGIAQTKKIIYGVALLFLSSFGFSLYWLGSTGIWVFLTVCVPAFFFFRELRMADTRKQFSKLSSICKWVMLIGMVSMAFLKI